MLPTRDSEQSENEEDVAPTRDFSDVTSSDDEEVEDDNADIDACDHIPKIFSEFLFSPQEFPPVLREPLEYFSDYFALVVEQSNLYGYQTGRHIGATYQR
ncbi:hypothetical protein Ciccas_009567 [Cichlidogyrus casuarinus]|uniref:Uncharacterized protein n=1 Tax=Cichlidogyrus casuarinus TaxID=1844966 RepID=A0ABD2PWN4_9PLAT